MHFNTIAQVAVAIVMALPAFALPVSSGQAARLSPRELKKCTFDKNGNRNPGMCLLASYEGTPPGFDTMPVCKHEGEQNCKNVVKLPPKVSAGTIWLPGKPITNPFKLPDTKGSMYGKRSVAAEEAAEPEEAEEEADLE